MTTTGDTAHQHGYEFPTPAAEPATGFDADNLTAADELAIDIGRVAIGAGEGVPYGSEPDEFFLAAGKAVFYWLQLNGHRRIATEEADEIRQVSNCAAAVRQYRQPRSRPPSPRTVPGHRTSGGASRYQYCSSREYRCFGWFHPIHPHSRGDEG